MDVVQVSIWMILGDLADPLMLVPALAMGWWARGRKVILGGVALIAVARIARSLLAPLPPGAERVLPAELLHVVAPLVISFAIFHLRRWLRSRDTAAPGSAFPRAVRTAIGGVLGACAGTALFLGLGLAVITLADIHDREGGEGYLLVFVIAPLGLLIGLVWGAVIAWRRSGRPIAAPISEGRA